MLRRLALAAAVLATSVPAVTAATWLGGKPAPASVERALSVELRATAGEAASPIGTPLPGRAIVAASLDATHFVWGVPTDKGAYCMGMTGPHARIDGADCTTASGGSLSSYLDCDGSVIIGGRVARSARRTARALLVRHDGTTLRIALDPARDGFFIARLRASFFRDVVPADRRAWPRTTLVDAAGHVVPPVRVNSGLLSRPDIVRC
jgi:hypothetical protein